MKISLRSSLLASSACVLSAGLVLLTGCGIGTSAGSGSNNLTGLSGHVLGGPTPIVNARVALYATQNNGYGGAGILLAKATQQGSSTDQDTDANGVFNFPTVTNCPAGQFAYIVVYGGDTGGGNNPNSVLMAPVGSCDTMYSGSGYIGSNTFIVVNELTTIASGYALSHFLRVTGDALSGYTVNVSAPASNNAAAGCVNNTYYGTVSCPATVTAGLAHAFATARALAGFDGTPNTTNAGSARIPATEINALGNVLESCVNSTGGGTDGSTGLPTAAIGVSGTSYTGTSLCAKLFAYATYTKDGTTNGGASSSNQVSAGNTLQAVQNLALRPSGNSTLFDTACSSNTTGTTPAAACIFNLGSANAYYTTPATLSSAPPDWVLGILYPKGNFSTAATSVTCGASAITTTSLVYPQFVATDINDNITILNSSDGSNNDCFNVMTIKNDGTYIGSSAIYNEGLTATLKTKSVGTDAFGHAFVGTDVGATLDIFAAGETDGSITRLQSVAASNGPAVAISDNSGNIYMANLTGVDAFQMLTVSGQSHTGATYTLGEVGTNILNKHAYHVSMDIYGNMWGMASATSASVYSYSPSTPSSIVYTSSAPPNSCDSSGGGTAEDTSGHFFMVAGVPTCSTTAGNTYVNEIAYSNPPNSSGTVGTATNPAVITNTQGTQSFPVMDGDNQLWWSYGSTTSGQPNALRGYDTINNYSTAGLNGCQFSSSSATICTNSSTSFLIYGTKGVAVDAAGNMWLANGTGGGVAEIIGLAAPTLPLFIHNGTSMKP